MDCSSAGNHSTRKASGISSNMPTAYRKILDMSGLRGKRILLRLDLNVPIVGEEVRDDFRIQKSLPTLEKLRSAGAKVIIISHLESDVTDSLSRVALYISRFIELKAFVAHLDDAPAVVDNLKEGEIIM